MDWDLKVYRISWPDLLIASLAHARTNASRTNWKIQIPRGDGHWKLNLKDQIKQIEGKVEAAYQAMLAWAGDCHFKNIRMETIWKLISACIIPIITHAGETRKPTKEEKKKLNQLLNHIIRRILMVPESTPEKHHIEKSGTDLHCDTTHS